MDFLDLTTLQILWYTVFIASIFAYSALDGFDIGVGCLHLFAKTDNDRRIFLNAIGPVWDGNSLWIVITAGVLFAGYPKAFSTLFSALYIPMMLLVFGYTLRAASIEFRSKVTNATWREVWDKVFAGSSFLLAFGLGIVLANLLMGLPIDSEGLYQGTLMDLLSPYSIVTGIYITILLMVHGGLYLNMKTSDGLQERVQNILYTFLTILVALWAIITHITLVFVPEIADNIRQNPIFFINEIVAIIGLTCVVSSLRRGWGGRAFLSSFIFIASQVANFSLGTFPYLIKSTVNEAASLTPFNSSASSLTMHILFGMALLGVPLFISYCVYSYHVFRGKVELDLMSY